jgi:hypothetical protein
MISKEQKIISLMPPKTASNAIRETLENNGVVFSVPIQKKLTPIIHLKLDEIVNLYDIQSLDEYKIFQIVRNPYHKFISGYYHQMRISPPGKGYKFIDYNITQFANHLYNSKKSKNFLEEFYGDTSFVYSHINSGLNWGGSRFFDTQSSWKNIDCNVKYFKLEEIKDNLSPIGEFLKLPLITLNKVNFGPRLKNHSDSIDSECKEIIDELFNDDFVNFGYEKTLN